MIGEQQLRDILHILKETAEKFRLLGDEIDGMLDTLDFLLIRQKAEERAQLLIDLFDFLFNKFTTPYSEVENKILIQTKSFAFDAKIAMNHNVNFALFVLLINQDYRVGDKNDLENFIDLIETQYLPTTKTEE